ncbi:DNA translocase FtsK [Liberiplasma polymorphum]|uniref:DNA translocase FtsK n=1 Tax=Liberiplasma polymorphum TaxID=3374570 RepID=UPI00377677F5
MWFKRKKKLVAPYKRSEDESLFQVYEILEPEEKHKYQKTRFVSPIFGENVKDEIVIPVLTQRPQDMDKLDSFRTRPKLTKEERIKRYGTAYPEFDLIRGKNLQEVLDSQTEGGRRVAKTKIVTPDEPAPYEPIEKPNHYEERTIEPVSEHVQEPVKETLKVEPVEKVVEPVKEEVKDDILVKEEKPLNKDRFVKSHPKQLKNYQLPPINLFSKPVEQRPDLTASIEKQISILNKTFEEFQIGARVHKHTQGPTVTRYEIVLDSGVNVRKITGIADNLKMSLAATQIRIEAPIPGKSSVGIEVPNEQAETVHFYDIINTSMFKNAAQPLTIGLGLDIDGHPVFASIKSMPHGLVAGATGSGKSVCINTILMSLLVKYPPSELKLILIDPKMVELSNYYDIPHLITPVITDTKAATAALKWVVDEMDRRFNVFSEERVRDIETYNQKMEAQDEHMPFIVVVIDELADLMMVSSQHVEDSIKRLTQKARACGIHLIIATQRPSTDVIKGTIKSNIPTRIAFSVASHVDSQTIIDSSGADKLLGRGDMLFLTNGQNKIRVQGAFVSDKDIEKVTNFIREQMAPDYFFDQDTLVKNIAKSLDRDEYFEEVARFVTEQQEASINKISKKFNIGFNRAQGIVESLEEIGIVSENLGSKARDVLVSAEDVEELLARIR